MPRSQQQRITRVVTIHIVRADQRIGDNSRIIYNIRAVDGDHSEYNINFTALNAEAIYAMNPIELQFLEDGPPHCRLMYEGVEVSNDILQLDIINPVRHRGGSWNVADFEREYLCEFIRKKKQKYPEMNCAFCDDKIHYPDHLREYLGPQQTKKYLEFCKKVGAKPTLYCCRCFETIKKNPKFFEAFNDMLKQYKLWKQGFEKMLEAGK